MKEDIKGVMENFNKTSDIVIDPIKQRINNPFVGSFILTFLALNWRPIVFFLLSDKSIEEKFIFITANYYADQWYGWLSWCMYLFFPIIISLIYLSILPWVTEIIDRFVHNTVLNKSRRDHIIDYRKRKNRADLAWADFKAEEARTGFEDRHKLNKELEGIKQTNKTLGETLERNIIEIGELKTNNLNLTNLNKELSSNNKILETSNKHFEVSVKQLDVEIKEKNETIEKLNVNNQNFSERINVLNIETSEKKQLIDQLNRSKIELESENKELNNIVMSLETSLAEFSEFEMNKGSLNQSLDVLARQYKEVPYPGFNGLTNSEYLKNLVEFLGGIEESENSLGRFEGNYLLTIFKEHHVSWKELLQEIYRVGWDMNLKIQRLNIIDENYVEINIFVFSENQLTEFINRGKGLWSKTDFNFMKFN